MDKLIITVAPTGAWPTKKDTPYVPLEPKEIADEVVACAESGASVAHIHVREDDGSPSMNFMKFKETVERIRDRSDIILNLTTSGGLGLSEEDRLKPFIELRPQIASFDAGSMNWMHSEVFENSPKFLERLAGAMNECNVKPEFEIFDSGMLYNVLYYQKKGIVFPPLHFQFVLGAPGGMAASVENLVFMKSLLPVGSTWSAFGIGAAHMPILFTTIALGGHVRVGMEDNIFYSKGVLAESNVDFVARAKRVSEEFGRTVASVEDAKSILF